MSNLSDAAPSVEHDDEFDPFTILQVSASGTVAVPDVTVSCKLQVIGLNGWYPECWDVSRRTVSADTYSQHLLKAVSLVSVDLLQGALKPKGMPEKTWKLDIRGDSSDPTAANSVARPTVVSHQAYICLSRMLECLWTSIDYRTGGKPTKRRGGDVEYWVCPFGRESRKSKEGVKGLRALDRRHKDCGCPVTYRVYELPAVASTEDHPISIVYEMGVHNHNPLSTQHLQTNSIDNRLQQQIIKYAEQGLPAAQIHKLVLTSALSAVGNVRRDGIDMFYDQRLFPSYDSIVKIINRRRLTSRSDDRRFVERIAAELPQNVFIDSMFEKTPDGKITSHLVLRVGSPVCNESLKRLMPGGLVLIDSTHNLNDYAYQVFTVMGIDPRTLESRVLEHLITSSADCETLERWLRSLAERAQGTPAEVIEDKCRTQTPAIEKAWPETHIHYCYFHSMKTFREEFTKAGEQQRQQLLSWLRRIYYSRDPQVLSENVFHLEAFLERNNLKDWKQYWESNWANCLSRWTRCHSIFKFVGTNNHLESYHKTLKHAKKAAGGRRILAVFDCVVLLLQQQFWNNNKILERATNHYQKSHLEDFRRRMTKSFGNARWWAVRKLLVDRGQWCQTILRCQIQNRF
eukprot:ANDGO_05982.mRNA.1 hypothetical protein PPTG_11304